MQLDRRIKIQLAIFAAVALVAGGVLIVGYIKLPAMLGFGRYQVIVELPRAGGLYKNANVTYRGTEVGRIADIRLTGSGVEAVLSLRSDVPIPSDLSAEVHSQSAVGEQYVALLPRAGESPPLRDGGIIPRRRSTVPPEISSLLDATDRGLRAIPRENLKTVVDESYVAVGGLGPELARIVDGSTQLALDSRTNLDSLTALIDHAQPVLDSQADTSAAIRAWAARLASVTDQLHTRDAAVARVLVDGGPAADEARQLFRTLQPTLPIVLANLVSVGDVAVTYQPALEQLLVLVPHSISLFQGGIIANHDTLQDYKGAYLDFNLNLNLPAPCTTGFLPAQQQRTPNLEDYPDRPAGEVYCRIPKDAPLTAVRGARNLPCLAAPGKRAPTVKMCESDEQYVPLNEGNNWKGDPNATLSGQDIPQLRPVPPLAVVDYDEATGSYVGLDGKTYTQGNLAQNREKQTWQSMLMPPIP